MSDRGGNTNSSDDASELPEVLGEIVGVARIDRSARPARLAFCTRWHVVGEDDLDIGDAFDEMRVDALPFVVSENFPIYLAVVWSGFAIPEKPRLHVAMPDGAEIDVRLPALKPYFSLQAQINSLSGFIFPVAGTYQFTVSTEYSKHSCELRIVTNHQVPR